MFITLALLITSFFGAQEPFCNDCEAGLWPAPGPFHENPCQIIITRTPGSDPLCDPECPWKHCKFIFQPFDCPDGVEVDFQLGYWDEEEQEWNYYPLEEGVLKYEVEISCGSSLYQMQASIDDNPVGAWFLQCGECL